MIVTLTKLSAIVRRGVIVGAVVIVLYYLWVFVIYPLSKQTLANMFPPKDPPTLLYGQLPPLSFSIKETKNESPPNFKLDTKDGRMPSGFPKKMTVYKFLKPIPSFQKGEQAVMTAKEFGFTDSDMVSTLKENVYRWKNAESGAAMYVNTSTKEFETKTSLYHKGSNFPVGKFSISSITEQADNLLKKIGRRNDELYKKGTISVSLGRVMGARVIHTNDIKEAQVVRVDYFRSINKFPILSPDPLKGLIYLVLKKYDAATPFYNYPNAECHEWSIETQSNASYPIIPVEQAWEKLISNQALLVNVTPKGEGNFSDYVPTKIEDVFINSIYLAYYDTPQQQEYLQPIWVFTGTYTTSGTRGGNITYYFPAITSENIKLPQTESQSN